MSPRSAITIARTPSTIWRRCSGSKCSIARPAVSSCSQTSSTCPCGRSMNSRCSAWKGGSRAPSGCRSARSASCSDSSKRPKLASAPAPYIAAAGASARASAASGRSQPSTTRSTSSPAWVANSRSMRIERAAHSAGTFGRSRNPLIASLQRADRRGVVARPPLQLSLERSHRRIAALGLRQQREPARDQLGRGAGERQALALDRRHRLRPGMRLEPVLDRPDGVAVLVERRRDGGVERAPLGLAALAP